MPIKAVLFDMFDTLMLIEKDHEFYQPALQRMYNYLNTRGIDVPFEKFESTYIEERDKLYAKADINLEEPHFNVRVYQTLKKLGYNYPLSSPLVAEATGEFCGEFMKYVRIDPDAAVMLNNLCGKYKLGIISNFAVPECVQTLLHDAKVDCYFSMIVVSGAVNKRKPSPDIFYNALKLMDVSPAEAVFVGDTVDADVEGSKAVGMKAIYLERRPQKISEEFIPDQTIKSLAELPQVLAKF
ncbi:MAG: HAD family hydrolase [Candidatus Bathyarchaeia archaeon]|jgi:FMN phosphatase YigB (HAD superfamily)